MIGANINLRKRQFFLEPITNIKQTAMSFVRDNNGFGLYIAITSCVFGFWPIGLFWLIRRAMIFYRTTYKQVFENSDVQAIVETYLLPAMRPLHFTTFGYRIFPEELKEHISFLKTITAENVGEMVKRAIAIIKRFPEYVVGMDIDSLTRHLIIVGTTGSGKTVTFLTMARDYLSKGAGLFCIDAKADLITPKKLYSLCKKFGREASFYLLNFLKPEEAPSTNTLNLLNNVPPGKASELMMNLIPSGDGNPAHFKESSKSLFRPTVFIHYIRKEYYRENFSLGDIGSSIQPQEAVMKYIMLYGTVKEINDKIIASSELQNMRSRAKGFRQPRIEGLEEIDILLAYIKANDTTKDMRQLFSQSIGIDFKFADTIFETCFVSLNDFMSKMSKNWQILAAYMAKAIYEYIAVKKKLDKSDSFFYNVKQTINITDLRKIYAELKHLMSQEGAFKRDYQSIADDSLTSALVKGGLDSPDGDQMKQYQFALQTLTPIFNTFNQFDTIFGAAIADVDMYDIFRNNKILFVLLPDMEMAAETCKTVGKIFLVLIKQAISLALGSEAELTAIQSAILKDRVTPKPIFQVNLDEYGSFASRESVSIAAQARSTNANLCIEVQDYPSLKEDGKDEFSASRLWGNGAKLILKSTCDETLSKVEKLIPEIDGFVSKVYDAGDLIMSRDLEATREKMIEVTEIADFKNGMGLLKLDGEPIFVQGEWYDAPQSDFVLTKLSEIKEAA